MDTCVAIAYWTILPPLSRDEDQSSIIFVSEKGQSGRWISIKNHNKESVKIEYMIFDIDLLRTSNSDRIRSVDLILSLSNFDPIDLYWVAKSRILTVQEAVQAKTMIY